MRILLLIPPLIVVTLAGGIAVCRATGRTPVMSDIVVAVVGILLASIAGSAVLWLSRGSDQAAVAQASLLAITIHLFIALGTAASIYMLKLAVVTTGFGYWLMALYWITLSVLAVASTRLVRQAAAVGGPAGVENRA